MKKIKLLVMAIGVIVVVAVAALAVLYLNLNGVVKSGIVKYGPRYTGTTVTVESVSLSPFSGSGEIKGLTIGNPDGYDGPYAMKFERIALTLDPKSLKEDKKIIHDVTVENADIRFIASSTGSSNIATIQKTIREAIPPSDSPTKMQIDKLTFTGGTIQVSVNGLPESLAPKPVALQPIEITEIGTGKDGATVAEVVQKVSGPLLEQVKDVARSAIDSLPEGAQDALDKGKAVLDGAKKLGIPGLGGDKK